MFKEKDNHELTQICNLPVNIYFILINILIKNYNHFLEYSLCMFYPNIIANHDKNARNPCLFPEKENKRELNRIFIWQPYTSWVCDRET